MNLKKHEIDFLKKLEDVVKKFQANKDNLNVRVSHIKIVPSHIGNIVQLFFIQEPEIKNVYFSPNYIYAPTMNLTVGKTIVIPFKAPATLYRLDFHTNEVNVSGSPRVNVFALNSKLQPIQNIYAHVSNQGSVCMGDNNNAYLNIDKITSDALFTHVLSYIHEFWSRSFKYDNLCILDPQVKAVLKDNYKINVSNIISIMYRVQDKDIDWDLFPLHSQLQSKVSYADATVLKKVKELIENN